MRLESFELVRVLIVTAITFIIAFLWMKPLQKFLLAKKMGKQIRAAENAPIFAKLHAKKAGTPTMGGILIWGTVLFVIGALYYLSVVLPDSTVARLQFFSRSETLLPLGALIASAIVGFVDDYFNIRKIGPNGGGLRMRHRSLIYFAIALAGAAWFSVKLDWDQFRIPFVGNFELGWVYMLCFIGILFSTAFSVNETDGLDGLAGGTLFSAFGAYAIISFAQGKYDLAVFCGAIIGALLAFLWYNIYPAKWFMGDTGSMSLGVTLGVIAMLTNTPLLLPLIGLVFVLESASVIIQVFVRKTLKRKWLMSAPFHHHLEAIGWEEPQIVMRLWVISFVAAGVGTALALLDVIW